MLQQLDKCMHLPLHHNYSTYETKGKVLAFPCSAVERYSVHLELTFALGLGYSSKYHQPKPAKAF